jgi:hypothetical protein
MTTATFVAKVTARAAMAPKWTATAFAAHETHTKHPAMVAHHVCHLGKVFAVAVRPSFSEAHIYLLVDSMGLRYIFKTI